MNATVARIVELIFEDYELSDEVQTIKDEVLTNCQERFEDCVARGLTEDEAIGAVAESLKGMDEVLKDYPKKPKEQSKAQNEDDDGTFTVEQSASGNFLFTADAIREVSVNLVCEDITFEPSEDDSVHVTYEDCPYVQVALRDGKLEITRTQGGNARVNTRINSNMPKLCINGNFINLKEIMSWASNMAKGFSFTYSDGGEITVRLPRSLCVPISVYTTSGDVELMDVNTNDLHCQTISGDLDVNLATESVNNVRLQTSSGDLDASLRAEVLEMQTVSGDLTLKADAGRASLRSTSGDMDLTLHADEAKIGTVSGDIEMEGAAQTLNIHTTSGDATVRGGMRNVVASTVSGDMHLSPSVGNEKLEISAKTTSGDMTVNLPREVTVQAVLNSRAGDVHNSHSSNGDNSDVKVFMSSVSGDLYIR